MRGSVFNRMGSGPLPLGGQEIPMNKETAYPIRVTPVIQACEKPIQMSFSISAGLV